MIDLSDITVIIRSAGERTINACELLLKDIFPAEQIKIIEEVPFSQAVRRSLEMGIEEKRLWIACVDADVLIDKKGVFDLMKKASEAPKEVFEVQGLILDKFFPVFRPAGNHLYRTAYAEKALKMIPKESTTLRPEATLLKNMAMAGYPWMQCDAVVGIHDFEQYYRDIFRKCFLQGQKHKTVLPFVIDYWLKQSKKDKDFFVAILGVLYSIINEQKVRIDKNSNRDYILNVLELAGVDEKEDEFEMINHLTVSQLINSRNEDWLELQEIFTPDLKSIKINNLTPPQVKSIANRVILFAGNNLTRIADRLLQIASK